MRFLTIFNIHERIALRYLKRHGLKMVARNYLSYYGEIDLIMLDKQYLVFIEVRFRKQSAYGTAEETVTASKQKKIVNTAQHFLQTNTQWQNYPIRFDVFGINGTQHNWIKSAF